MVRSGTWLLVILFAAVGAVSGGEGNGGGADEIIALGRALEGDCGFECYMCFPTLQHRIEATPFGAYESPHPEPCNDFGSCEDHECGLAEAEGTQAFLDALLVASDAELVEVVHALPERFAIDRKAHAILVRDCRREQFMARIPVSEGMMGSLRIGEPTRTLVW